MTAPTESEAASRPATDPLALALAPATAITANENSARQNSTEGTSKPTR